jgi:hypothetical protein
VINGDLKVIHSTEDQLILKDNKGGAAILNSCPQINPIKVWDTTSAPTAIKNTNTSMCTKPFLTCATKSQEPNCQRGKHDRHSSKDYYQS